MKLVRIVRQWRQIVAELWQLYEWDHDQPEFKRIAATVRLRSSYNDGKPEVWCMSVFDRPDSIGLFGTLAELRSELAVMFGAPDRPTDGGAW